MYSTYVIRKFMHNAHKLMCKTNLNLCAHPKRTYAYGMTYTEFLRQLGKAGLTVKEFATLLGMNRNSITNCAARGEVPVHLAVIASLMAEMAEHRLDFRQVMLRIPVEPKKARGAGQHRRFGGDPQEVLGLSFENKEKEIDEQH